MLMACVPGSPAADVAQSAESLVGEYRSSKLECVAEYTIYYTLQEFTSIVWKGGVTFCTEPDDLNTIAQASAVYSGDLHSTLTVPTTVDNEQHLRTQPEEFVLSDCREMLDAGHRRWPSPVYVGHDAESIRITA